MTVIPVSSSISFFFFNDTATTEIYTLSLHDALPIFTDARRAHEAQDAAPGRRVESAHREVLENPLFDGLQVVVDRKSTRLNSSHSQISYAVFCLKKKKTMLDSPHTSRYTTSTAQQLK